MKTIVSGEIFCGGIFNLWDANDRRGIDVAASADRFREVLRARIDATWGASYDLRIEYLADDGGDQLSAEADNAQFEETAIVDIETTIAQVFCDQHVWLVRDAQEGESATCRECGRVIELGDFTPLWENGRPLCRSCCCANCQCPAGEEDCEYCPCSDPRR